MILSESTKIKLSVLCEAILCDISTLAEVLAPCQALPELSATLPEVYAGPENSQPPSPTPFNASATSHSHKEAADNTISPTPSAKDENNDLEKLASRGED